MKWYFLFWAATSMSLSPSFASETECIAALETAIKEIHSYPGWPSPGGICVQGVAKP